jgi:hypothetical protein
VVNLIKRQYDGQDKHWTLSGEQYTGEDLVSYRMDRKIGITEGNKNEKLLEKEIRQKIGVTRDYRSPAEEFRGVMVRSLRVYYMGHVFQENGMISLMEQV